MTQRVSLAQLAGFSAFLVACDATLVTPPDANIICSSDAECPDDRRCQVLVGLCYDPTIADERPPLLLTANAADSTQVVLDFSERMDPGTLGLSGLAIDPPLDLADPVLLPNYRQLRIITSLQEPGVAYAITVSGAADISGNVIAAGATASFFGFGAAPDRGPPAILGPSNAQAYSETTLTLVWTRPPLARSYTVEVAYDAGFTRLLPRFPMTVDDPTSSVSYDFVEPVRYYWRVRANTTREGEYATSTFDRLGGVLHVHCPAGVPCSDVDAEGRPRPGNASAPMQTVAGAINTAKALLIPEVHIAARGNGEAYREHLVVDDVTLLGGYESTFTDAPSGTTNPTIIEADDEPAVLMLGGGANQRLARLTLRSMTDAALGIMGASNATVEDCDIAGGRAGIEATSFGNALIQRNTVHSFPGSNGNGVVISSAERADVLHNVISVSTCGAGRCQAPAGIRASDVSVMVASDNTIDVRATPNAERTFGITTSDVGVDLQRNWITTGDGMTTALELRWGTAIQFASATNNIVLAGGSTAAEHESYALIVADNDIFNAEENVFVIANNLFYVGGGPGSAVAVFDGQNRSTYVNNIMFTGAAATRICFSDSALAGHIVADFRNNLLFECPTALFSDLSPSAPTSFRTNIADVNDAATSTQGAAGSVGGNITATLPQVALASFPADVHLTSGTLASIRFGGMDATASICGYPGNLGCGAVTHDYDGVARSCPTPVTSCFSIGPYELDP